MTSDTDFEAALLERLSFQIKIFSCLLCLLLREARKVSPRGWVTAFQAVHKSGPSQDFPGRGDRTGHPADWFVTLMPESSGQ